MANSNFRTITLDQLDGVVSIKNCIKNGTATANTKGWATYADAAGTAPVDGTGGSVNTGTEINWSRTTSSPLSLDASFLFSKIAASSMQGKGVSYDFTVNSADKAKVHTINFDYEVASGTYADGDLTVWIYDVTNGGPPIQPSASSILNGIGPQQKQTLSFQTNSNSTSYRLIIHCASTSAVAYTVKFDNFQVSRQSVSQGTVVTDWVSYTPTLTNGTNVSVTKVSWRRVGDSVEILGYLSVGGAGSGTDLAVSLPSGIVMDTGKINGSANNHVLGSGEWLDNGTGRFVLMPVYVSATSFSFQKQQIGSLQGSDLASGDAVSFTISVPILGWSSSQQLSSDADTRVVAMTARNYSNGTLASGASHTVILNTVATDTHGAYNSATGEYTVKVPGMYSINGEIGMSATAAAATRQLFLYIRVSGTGISNTYSYANTTNTLTHRAQARVNWYCNAGDIITLVAENDLGATGTPHAGTGNSNFSINLIQGPAQIAASEPINLKYQNGASTTLTGGAGYTDIPFATKTYDTHGSFSTPTFTAPAPGKYEITFNLYFSAANLSTSQAIDCQIVNNGTAETKQIMYGTGVSRQFSLQATDTYDLLAGQTLKVRAASDVTISLVATAARNYVTIKRIS